MAAAVLALVGCGHGPLAVRRAANAPVPGARYRWLDEPDLAERASAAAKVMAQVWGGRAGDLEGWTITFRDRVIARDGKVVTVGRATRVPVLGGGHIEIWAGTSKVCLEATDLAHEVGHVVIRDGGHEDLRWLDPGFWDRMAEALQDVVPLDDHSCRRQLASGKGIWH